jgi:hypothetical protein
MKDLRDPQIRQKFLQDSINRNLMIEKLKKVQTETFVNRLIGDAKLLGSLIEFFENSDEAEYTRLTRKFKLRKLNLI